jgi:ribosomal protein S18 acetylase RimI-like enzyme
MNPIAASTNGSLPDMSALDHPLWLTLNGPRSDFGTVRGNAARFLPDVSTLAALAPYAQSNAWDDLHDLLTAGEYVALFFFDPAPPIPAATPFRVVYEGDYDQMLCTALTPPATPLSTPPLVSLGRADAAEMLALVELTEPGPFAMRTHEIGRYLGIRADSGQLVAMAGERARMTGWVEISAVCTHPDHRGRGYAERLVRELTADVLARRNGLFLHVRSDNHVARRAYERIGFRIRRSFKVIAVQRPRAPTPPSSSEVP